LNRTSCDGLVGLRQYSLSFGRLGACTTSDSLVPVLIGKHPRAFEAHVALRQALRRPSAGGIVQQATGAIENALLDLKARALEVPVYELFGGPLRDRQRVYWSDCGNYRDGGRARAMQIPEIR